MSELTGNRIRTTAGKHGLPHLAETSSSTWSCPRNWLSVTTAVAALACGCARVPRHKTLDEYDFSCQLELDSRRGKDRACCGRAGERGSGVGMGELEQITARGSELGGLAAELARRL
ncbi:hypothetical protein PH203_47125 [Streptomyces sp. S.PB5]|nr:hypothetical protein [Streptomyces sp. S.PB5]MDN3029321.1 hypothetical protein [Streptomyces sp. S.PB5]